MLAIYAIIAGLLGITAFCLFLAYATREPKTNEEKQLKLRKRLGYVNKKASMIMQIANLAGRMSLHDKETLAHSSGKAEEIKVELDYLKGQMK